MKTLIVGFGDSWTFGSELDRPQEQSWVAQLASKLDCEHVNQSCPASSIGHLTVQLFDFIKKDYTDYKKIFMVGLSGSTRYLTYNNSRNEFANITPDTVYSTSDIYPNGQPPQTLDHMRELLKQTYMYVEHTEYNKFLATQTIFLFQQYCYQHNIDVVFFSYFDKINFDKELVNTDIIYPTSITQALTGSEYSQETMTHEYFLGKLFHPNIAGHAKIAELLKDYYDSNYPGN
jgi:hypothetical protein